MCKLQAALCFTKVQFSTDAEAEVSFCVSHSRFQGETLMYNFVPLCFHGNRSHVHLYNYPVTPRCRDKWSYLIFFLLGYKHKSPNNDSAWELFQYSNTTLLKLVQVSNHAILLGAAISSTFHSTLHFRSRPLTPVSLIQNSDLTES